MLCSQCGQEHSLDELELSFRRPDVVAAMSEEARFATVKEDSDLCAIQGQRYFIRTFAPIPVIGRHDPYCIGIWAEVNLSAFRRVLDLWSEPDQEDERPMDAVLANEVPGMNTLGLAVRLYLAGPKSRPKVVVVDTATSLGQEQAKGITAHRANEYTNQ